MALSKLRAPEMFPRGSSGDPTLDDLRGRLTDWGNIITNTINNIINDNDTNVLNIGIGGLDNTCRIIGSTTPNLSLLGNRLTGGNETLKLTEDGQLVFCWLERSAGNTNTFYAKKAASPYLIWTSLDGTSQDATLVVQTTTLITTDEPVFCEDVTTGSLHFFYYAPNGANAEIRDMVLPRDTTDETIWTAGSYNVVCQTNASATIQQSGCTIKLGDAICTGTGIYFIGYELNADIGQVFRSNNGISWGAVIRYYNPIGGTSALDGDTRRLIDLGDERILVLMETHNGTNYQLVYDILDETTPAYNPALGVQPRTNATGYFLPPASSNIKTSGNGGATFCTWTARRIPDTKRVGVLFIGINSAASGSQTAGTRYTEFDGDTGAWTALSGVILLSAADIDVIGVTPTVLSTNASGVQLADGGGHSLFATDGVLRGLWFQGSQRNSAGSYPNGIAYRRLVDNGTPAVSTDWYTLREVHSFGGNLSADFSRKGEFQGCRDLVTIGEATYAPVVWTRGIGGVASSEFCFKLLPTVLMDLP